MNGMAHRNKLYSMEHLWHWWNRRIEFSYAHHYRVPVISSKHYPKVRISFKVCGLRITYEKGIAPWDE